MTQWCLLHNNRPHYSAVTLHYCSSYHQCLCSHVVWRKHKYRHRSYVV